MPGNAPRCSSRQKFPRPLRQQREQIVYRLERSPRTLKRADYAGERGRPMCEEHVLGRAARGQPNRLQLQGKVDDRVVRECGCPSDCADVSQMLSAKDTANAAAPARTGEVARNKQAGHITEELREQSQRRLGSHAPRAVSDEFRAHRGARDEQRGEGRAASALKADDRI